MDVKDAYEFMMAHLLTDVGRFYGSGQSLSLGAGLLFRGVRYPIYVEATYLFMTVRGMVYVLTHECDVDPNNIRPFNDDVLICPVIPLGDFDATV
jgi:hypothetical protein